MSILGGVGVIVVIVVIAVIRSAASGDKDSPSTTANSDGSVPAARFEVGKCMKVVDSKATPTVDPKTGEAEVLKEYEPVECDDKDAYARITQVQPASLMSSTPDCPRTPTRSSNTAAGSACRRPPGVCANSPRRIPVMPAGASA